MMKGEPWPPRYADHDERFDDLPDRVVQTMAETESVLNAHRAIAQEQGWQPCPGGYEYIGAQDAWAERIARQRSTKPKPPETQKTFR